VSLAVPRDLIGVAGPAGESSRSQPMNGADMTNVLRRTLLSTTAVAALAVLPPVAALAQAGPPKNKAVFQVSDADPQKWNLTLNNVKNVVAELGEDAVELEIVVYGPGIGMLKAESPVGNRVAEVLGLGVKVVACENTMKAQKLVYADMLPKIGYVPAGVVELMKKQREGYAYIRP
jgi:intracellular sulfur oxidation DsrE/DsrF family protein